MWNAQTYQGAAGGFDELRARDLASVNPADVYTPTAQDLEQLNAASAAARALLGAMPPGEHVRVTALGHGDEDLQPGAAVTLEIVTVPAPVPERA